jgi:hypothetical protein
MSSQNQEKYPWFAWPKTLERWWELKGTSNSSMMSLILQSCFKRQRVFIFSPKIKKKQDKVLLFFNKKKEEEEEETNYDASKRKLM